MSISYSSIFQSYQYVYSISMWVHTDTHTYIHNINTGVWPHLKNYCSTESLQLVQFSSVTQSCSTLCDPMNCSMPGILLHHQLLEFTQTDAHQVGDAIQPSHSLLAPSPPAPNPSQHQGLFQWVNSWHEVAKVLEFQPQHQFCQWTPRTDLL